MNYEQKYKDALEKARQLCAYPTTKPFISDLQDLFPELIVSEDERIRKELINFAKSSLAGFPQCEKYIAWLEKQGNKDSQVILPQFTFDDILALQCCMETVKKVQEDKDLYEKLKDLHGRVYDAYQLEKQNNNADKVKQQQTIEIPFGAKDSELQEVTYHIPDGYHAEINGNEVIIKKGEQKSFWSEEDEKKRTLLIRILEVNHPNGYFKVNPANTLNMEAIHTEELVFWLKSLRPQNRWTPSEKQGEQKPINTDFKAKDCYVSKAEPKFHVYDWVVTDKGDTVQIGSVNNGYYTIGNGMLFSMPYVDTSWHLWTIKDANDGDVLAEDSCIFIIQKLCGITAAKTYCTLFDDDDFDSGSTLYFDIDSTKPATQEQRDILFAKMKSAGYIWDVEKKVLNKVNK